MAAATTASERDRDPGLPVGDVAYRPKLGSHLPALDGLRGVAILMVLLLHFGWRDAPNGKQLLVEDIIARVPMMGWLGVQLFFVLSGFLITGILVDAKGSPHYLRNFYARRVLRIFPLYYGVLLFIYLFAPLFRPLFAPGSGLTGGNPWWLFLYGVNIFITVTGDNFLASDWLNVGHFWTLAVEEQFYLAWPFVVLLFRRKALMAVCVACIAGALALRVVLLHINTDTVADSMMTPCNLDALAIGAWLALAARGPGGLAACVPWARGVALACGLVLFAITDAVVLGNLDLHDGWFMRTYGKTIAALCFGGLLVLAVTQPAGTLEGRFWNNAVLRFFGKYSYGIYVYHMLLLVLFEEWFPRERLLSLCSRYWLPASLLFQLLATAASVAVAFVSWHLYEKQFLKLKVFFEYRGDRRATGRLPATLPAAPPPATPEPAAP